MNFCYFIWLWDLAHALVPKWLLKLCSYSFLCLLHPTVIKGIMFLGCVYVRSSSQILLPRYIMNGFNKCGKTDGEYLLVHIDDPIRLWRSKVKVTAGPSMWWWLAKACHWSPFACFVTKCQLLWFCINCTGYLIATCTSHLQVITHGLESFMVFIVTVTRVMVYIAEETNIFWWT